MNSLSGKHILLGVSGGIAAYKALEICRLCRKKGTEVQVVMTAAAREFVAPLSFETLSGRPVYQDVFDRRHGWEIEHVSYAQWGDLLLIAPATANVLAKMAAGMADDPLTTTALAFNGPVLVAPAMNTAMWNHPQTRENLQKLRDRGVGVIPPGTGDLACGDAGEGRLADLAAIMADLEEQLALPGPENPLSGKQVLITAGPTVEEIDPVRYISNPASGRTGYALAREATRRGARVTLVTGPTPLEKPALFNCIEVRSAREMRDAVLTALDEQDICVFSAAVSDYAPASREDRKIKKGEGALHLGLERTPDVALEAHQHRHPGQFFIGFAAETEELEANCLAKMEQKGFNVVVGNLISAANPAFSVEDNAVVLFHKNGQKTTLPKCSKDRLAREIWDFALTVQNGVGGSLG